MRARARVCAVTARPTEWRDNKGKKGEDERRVFPKPRWFVTLDVRHTSPGLPGALLECELLQQESASERFASSLQRTVGGGEGEKRTTDVCRPHEPPFGDHDHDSGRLMLPG